MAAAFRGTKLATEAAPIVSEYIQRKRLAKLGYISNLGELSYFKAQSFCWIDQELERLESEKMKKNRKGRR